MDNETETIKESILNLPKSLKDYVLSDVWSQKLNFVQQTNKLSDIQSAALNGEIFLILAGIENYSGFTANVQKNVSGINGQTVFAVVADIEKNIFAEVKTDLLEVEKNNNGATEETIKPEVHPDKETIIDAIENPTPVKPIIVNPAGVNPILDGQHNLPEGETKIEKKPMTMSSSAVPSRGPMIGNFKSNFNSAPIAPIIKPAQTPPASAPAKYTTDPYREPAL